MKESEIQSVKQRFGIIGNSPMLNQAVHRAILAAQTDLSVLITGESGSGKESFSKIIHQLSARKHGQFIAINCGAIPEGTIYSELFGHEKNSFTGSSSSEARKGFFETADGGTIFLDEVGELPPQAQAMLLRVLESGEFIRMGSSKAQKTNVRVVAATNVNLEDAVLEKKFREDLYYRLNTLPISVPALRERGNDIILLFRKFSADFAERYRLEAINLTDDGKEALLKFRFPGNIRQLKNLVEQMSLLEVENREINAQTLTQYLPQEQRTNALAIWAEGKANSTDSGFANFSEREILYKVLFDMRKDVTELKKLVFQILQNDQISTEILRNHEDLFRSIQFEENDLNLPVSPQPETVILNNPYSNKDTSLIPFSKTEDKETVHDITHEEESNSLSIEDKEKELILKALQKNRNKRKYAAQDLGISERTLYRKIKQYDLEKYK
jgi:transcriptional regulator with PAS, ATPase and Fis domain